MLCLTEEIRRVYDFDFTYDKARLEKQSGNKQHLKHLLFNKLVEYEFRCG